MYDYYTPYLNDYRNGFTPGTPISNGYPNMSFQRNPQPSQQNQNGAQNNTFQWVQGQAGAEAYLVAPGASVILMDSNAPVIYFKSADQNGRYLPMKTYDLVERVPQVQGPNPASAIDTTSFVKRDEITTLVAKAVDEYLSVPAKKEA